jgi:hypothetical protein
MIKSGRMGWVEHAACMGEIRIAYKILVRKPEAKRPLGRCRSRWEDNIKMDLRECCGLDSSMKMTVFWAIVPCCFVEVD